ncbi:MAG TPA: aspartate carbamoyltransferase [Nitrolancea sp.]|jgi:aspartate carbamoyltransferase catalytic subunit|nr:aspartate carbamoyltransferase [Nitrolancea sp.]
MHRLRNVLEVRQFDRPHLDSLFARADEMRIIADAGGSNRLSGKILATLFFEPSTRTRLSFESAMTRLGGAVLTAENAIETSSWAKGETIEDTARIVESYADAIVMRHPEAGAPSRAAAVINIPVINAGDGAREHPTQALLDLYTIGHELGRIDNLRIALVGDLKYGRAPRSLALLLTEFSGIELTFISPPNVRMGDDVKDELRTSGVTFEEESDLLAVLPDVDVVYQTRIQRERFTSEEEYRATCGKYVIDAAAMAALNPQAVVLHPLPRVNEIDPIVDGDRRAAYFRQARNGVYVRMAILDWLLRDE